MSMIRSSLELHKRIEERNARTPLAKLKGARRSIINTSARAPYNSRCFLFANESPRKAETYDVEQEPDLAIPTGIHKFHADYGPSSSSEKKVDDFGTVRKCDKSGLLPTNN
jgi:hypothetical protein